MHLDDMAAALETTGRYRVLRQLVTDPEAFRPMPDRQFLPSGSRIGLYVDVETTSLDPRNGDIIELAMVPFTFTDDGQIIEIFQPFQQLQQPSHPIPPAITELTGIDDAMVAGKSIDIDAVVGLVAADRNLRRAQGSFRSAVAGKAYAHLRDEAVGLLAPRSSVEGGRL
jgi:DNA polymerase-3 subunit epsilon